MAKVKASLILDHYTFGFAMGVSENKRIFVGKSLVVRPFYDGGNKREM